MILLGDKTPPTSTAELISSLNEALGQTFQLSAGRTVVQAAGEFPALERLVIDLTDAQIGPSFRPAEMTKPKDPAFTVREFRLLGRPLRQGEAAIHFEVALDDAQFVYRRDVQDRVYLQPADGAAGRFFLRGTQEDFRTALLAQLRGAATEYGVAIEEAEWTLTGQGNRALNFQSRIHISKNLLLFKVGTTFRTRGKMDIDEALNARFSELAFEGEGVLGTLLVALAQERLRRLEGTTLPLASLGLGRMKLRDLQITCNEELRIEAVFATPEEEG